jgi:hypothetical protein
MDSSNRTFVELDDFPGSEDKLQHKTTETGSVATHSSQAPITGRLVPSAGRGFGNRVKVDAGDLEAQRSRDTGNSIVTTKTVKQSRHHV